MLLEKLAKSKINYRPGDFKAEIHFLGQIIGATNVMEKDAIFIEAYFVVGDQWRFLSNKSTIQTQACFIDNNNYACFAHPFDLHFTSENLSGWPRMVVRIWKIGMTNKVDLMAYGTQVLPNIRGYHEIEFQTWSLHGGLTDEALCFFLEGKPRMNTSDPVDSFLCNRKNIISKPGPKVKISCEVITRNFTFHSLSGVIQNEDNDDDDTD